jgi:hypothetical protein
LGVESDISAEYPGGEDVQEMRNSERGVLEVEEEEGRYWWEGLVVLHGVYLETVFIYKLR